MHQWRAKSRRLLHRQRQNSIKMWLYTTRTIAHSTCNCQSDHRSTKPIPTTDYLYINSANRHTVTSFEYNTGGCHDPSHCSPESQVVRDMTVDSLCRGHEKGGVPPYRRNVVSWHGRQAVRHGMAKVRKQGQGIPSSRPCQLAPIFPIAYATHTCVRVRHYLGP